MDKQQIILPHLKQNEQFVTSFYAHTFREGGFRIQQQNLNQKCIFHNYGQGDAEYSLSYGSAYMISKIITVKQDASQIKQVAVLGNGVNAFMTALQLLKRGYKVNLYGHDVQPKNQKRTIKITDLHEGYHFWYPGGYDNCDALKHQLISKLSYQYFLQCTESNRYQSLKQITCYISPSKLDQLKLNVTDYINSKIKSTILNFENSKMENMIAYQTILFDTKLFMQQIYTQSKLRNINIIQREFTTIQDVINLKQKYIFNCLTGQQSGAIFGDNNVQVINGCAFTMSIQVSGKPDKFCLWVSSEIQSQNDPVIFCINKKLQIKCKNSMADSLQIVKQAGEKMLIRAYYFIKQRIIKPYKL